VYELFYINFRKRDT